MNSILTQIVDTKKHMVENIINNNKIAILTPIIGENYRDKCKYGIYSKKMYCEHNNYDLILANDIDYDNILHKNKRCGWVKVYKLLDFIDQYDYIFISDADVSIMNYKIQLESIIQNYFDFNTLMLITRDQNNINSGNFIIKGKSELCKKFMNLWKECLPNKYKYIGEQDQPSLIHLILNTDFKQYVKIIDQSIINSYPDIPINKHAKLYSPGDLLIHYAGYSYHKLNFSNDMKENLFKSIES